MAILFPVKSEMAILFFVKRDPGPPFTTLLSELSDFGQSEQTRALVNSSTGKNVNCSLKLLKFLRYFRYFVPVKGLSIILAFWRLFNDQEIKACLYSY